jgi:hypothetical protein
MKKYKEIFTRWSENLRFSDLKKNAGMSAFTKKHKKIRNKAIGTDTATIKLIDAKIDNATDSITFYFQTGYTPIYPPDYQPGMTIPDKGFEIVPNRDDKYIMQLKVLDFFTWLDTSPDEITVKDIEDVFKVADVQYFCECPSFHWQGANYISSQFDASIYPTNIAPTQWDSIHHDDNFVCKHLSGVLTNIEFYIPQMRQKIIKAIR